MPFMAAASTCWLSPCWLAGCQKQCPGLPPHLVSLHHHEARALRLLLRHLLGLHSLGELQGGGKGGSKVGASG